MRRDDEGERRGGRCREGIRVSAERHDDALRDLRLLHAVPVAIAVAALARDRGSQRGDPDFVRSRDALAVVLGLIVGIQRVVARAGMIVPGLWRFVPAAMIGGDDQRGLPAVVRVVLQLQP